jgi:hypothetical protein
VHLTGSEQQEWLILTWPETGHLDKVQKGTQMFLYKPGPNNTKPVIHAERK